MTDRELYSPGNAYGAQARIEGEKWTRVLIREIRHRPEKVWEALTEPGLLREWAPFDSDSSLADAGAMVQLTAIGGPTPCATEEKVIRADAANKLLEYTWDGRGSSRSMRAGLRSKRPAGRRNMPIGLRLSGAGRIEYGMQPRTPGFNSIRREECTCRMP